MSRHWRWLFASIPVALLLASLAAWAVPDIAFYEAWPAFNVMFFLVGLAVIPVFSPTASLARKLIILAGLLLAVLTFFPLFKALTAAANPDLAKAQATVPITVRADPATCSFQGSPVAREVDFTNPCDIAKRALAQNSASYLNEAGPAGSGAVIKIGDKEIVPPTGVLTAGGHKFDEASGKAIAQFKKDVTAALKEAGYPAKADPAKVDKVKIVLILSVLVLYVTMVYGPIAAMLVEMFPTRIRYTSMSLPYHIGNGWFGGLMPTIAFAMVAQNGNIYHGLWYPITIAAITFVIGLLFVRETKDVDIYAGD